MVQWLQVCNCDVRRVQSLLGAGFKININVGTYGCGFGQGTSSSLASLHSGVNECLLDEDDNAYDMFHAPEWLLDCMIFEELRWHMDELIR